MQTDVTFHVNKGTKVDGYILAVPSCGRVMYLKVSGDEGNDLTFIVRNPDFLDRLSNEAERLTREFVGDVPPLEPLPAPSQAYLDEIGEMQTAELHGGPEVA